MRLFARVAGSMLLILGQTAGAASCPSESETTLWCSVSPGQRLSLPSLTTKQVVVVVDSSNRSTAPIVIGNTRRRSTISNLTPVRNWERMGTLPVYRAALPRNTTAVAQVFEKTATSFVRMKNATTSADSSIFTRFSLNWAVRHDSDAHGVLFANPSDIVRFRAESGSQIWNPLYLIARTDNWRFVRRTVTSVEDDRIGFSGGTIVFAETPTVAVSSRGYLIGNVAPRSPGEWSHDRNYLYFHPTSPAALNDIVASFATASVPNEVERAGLRVWASGYRGSLAVTGIDVFGAAGNGIHVDSDGPVTVLNVAVNLSGESGIYANSKEAGVLARDNVVLNSQDDGIVLIGVAAEAQRNKIYSSGYLGTQTALEKLSGLYLAGNSRVIASENDIRNSGGAAITTSQPRGELRIMWNYLEDSCRELNDCGALYVSSNNVRPRPGEVYHLGGNIIQGVKGNWDGMLGYQAKRMTAGIYLDFCASGFLIEGNRIDQGPSATETNGLADIYGLGVNSVSGNVAATTVMTSSGATGFSALNEGELSLCSFLWDSRYAR